jgi:hypothetical protein
MSQVSLIGHLTRDPELRTGKDGVKRSEHSVRGSVEFLGTGSGGGSRSSTEPLNEELALAF